MPGVISVKCIRHRFEDSGDFPGVQLHIITGDSAGFMECVCLLLNYAKFYLNKCGCGCRGVANVKWGIAMCESRLEWSMISMKLFRNCAASQSKYIYMTPCFSPWIIWFLVKYINIGIPIFSSKYSDRCIWLWIIWYSEYIFNYRFLGALQLDLEKPTLNIVLKYIFTLFQLVREKWSPAKHHSMMLIWTVILHIDS